jgi:hypothetical protein
MNQHSAAPTSCGQVIALQFDDPTAPVESWAFHVV